MRPYPENSRTKSLTLIELLIAIILLSVVVLAFANIQIFGHFQVLTGDRRAKAQSEAAKVLAHMGKEIPRAIGNEAVDGLEKVVDLGNRGDGDEVDDAFQRLRVYIDANENGKREPYARNRPADQDHWISYRYFNSGDDRFEVKFCATCRNQKCGHNRCAAPGWQDISNKITGFGSQVNRDTSGKLQDNFIEVTVTACWDPAEAHFPCGDRENPKVELRSRIQMPSVSTH